MKKIYTNAEIVVCRLSSEDIMSSSAISKLEGSIAVDNSTAPGIGGDDISIGFDG